MQFGKYTVALATAQKTKSIAKWPEFNIKKLPEPLPEQRACHSAGIRLQAKIMLLHGNWAGRQNLLEWNPVTDHKTHPVGLHAIDHALQRAGHALRLDNTANFNVLADIIGDRTGIKLLMKPDIRFRARQGEQVARILPIRWAGITNVSIQTLTIISSYCLNAHTTQKIEPRQAETV